MRFLIHCLLLLGLAGAGVSVKAQTPLVHGEPNVWFLLLNHYHISPRWKIGNELHLRRDAWFRDQQQFIARPYVDFKLQKSVHLTAGYSYLYTSPYGDFPLPISQPEHNVWTQAVLNHSAEKNSFSHRYRMEHRFRGQLVEQNNGEYEVDGYGFSNRFRYRITWKRPLNDQFFLTAFDEVWVNFSDRMQLRSFDRNWIYAALGVNFLESGNVQLAYLHQWAQNNPARFERHHGVQLTVQYDIFPKGK